MNPGTSSYNFIASNTCNTLDGEQRSRSSMIRKGSAYPAESSSTSNRTSPFASGSVFHCALQQTCVPCPTTPRRRRAKSGVVAVSRPSIGPGSRQGRGGRRRFQIGSRTVRRTGPSWRRSCPQECSNSWWAGMFHQLVAGGDALVHPPCLELRLQCASERPVQLLGGNGTRDTDGSCCGGLLLPIVRLDDESRSCPRKSHGREADAEEAKTRLRMRAEPLKRSPVPLPKPLGDSHDGRLPRVSRVCEDLPKVAVVQWVRTGSR